MYASINGAIELTDRGKLLGEIPLGYYMVRREIERIDGFPPAEAEGLLHIILSHHGKLEHGSPVVPCTREATLVHFVDNLGGNLGQLRPHRATLADGASWSDYDRGICTVGVLRAARAGAARRGGLAAASSFRCRGSPRGRSGTRMGAPPMCRWAIAPSMGSVNKRLLNPLCILIVWPRALAAADPPPPT